MGVFDSVIKKGRAQLSPPKRPKITYAKDPVAPKNRSDFESREGFIREVRNNPDTKDVPIESIYTAWQGGQGLPSSPAPAPYIPRQQQTSGGSSGGGRRGGGGRGGGGGGSNAAALAQSQLDFLIPVLAGKNYTAQPLTGVRQAISDREAGIGTSTAADLATSKGAYDYLDQWLGTNLNDPYANVKLSQARVAGDQNPYLTSQGVEQGLNPQATNPDDAYGGFQNMLALLGANARQMKQSSQAGSGMARASSTTGISAMDNAYRDVIKQQLAGVASQESQNQLALDAERRQAIMQILPLLGAGAKAPADVMAQLGLA